MLRRGLAAGEPAPSARRRFAFAPHASRLQPGVDPDKLNQLADQIEAEDFSSEARGRDRDAR